MSISPKVSLDDAFAWGFSGVMVRGSGAAWDLRKSQPYECYDELEFDIPVGKHGDCYDRYLVRMEEMRQSVSLMRQCCERLRNEKGPMQFSHQSESRAAQARRDEAFDGSADPSLSSCTRKAITCLPARFTRLSRRPRASLASIWFRTDPTNPIAARSARRAFPICRPWISCVKGHMLADVAAVIGSLDIVFGEVDR